MPAQFPSQQPQASPCCLIILSLLIRGGVLALAASLFPGVSLGAEEPAPSDESREFFDSRVLPILKTRCLECHSHAAGKSKGGLMLDSRSGWQTGGDSGTAVIPGRPDDSLLIQAVRHTELRMPPTGRLPADEVATLERWVLAGAFDPRETLPTAPTAGPASPSEHWAFQPLSEPAIPNVRDSNWPTGPVDHFIWQGLDQRQLAPSPDADRATWLRRVSFDLTGLPPTVGEQKAFLADVSPDADSAVVDRLLSSPAYGERWARHWLDLVGYADQIGTSNNVFAEQAWRYRDHVIQSLNSDKPWDRFLTEQIAGDLLPARSEEERADQMIATGFLLLGDLSIVEADKAKLRIDTVDQQIDKIGRAMLGLTLGCARCHDHKFDPISQHDYYAMAGILFSTHSVERATWGVWSYPVQRELPETPAARREREQFAALHETQVRGWQRELAQLRTQKQPLDAALAQQPPPSPEQKAELEKQRQQIDAQWRRLENQLVHAEFFRPRPPRALAVQDEPDLRDMRLTIRGNAHALGPVVPRGFPKVLQTESPPAIPDYQSGRLELARWITHPRHPLTARVAVNRIWQKLFGEGLVRSVDYLGVRGERPSHPELLDWLARRYQDLGWSQKQLLRELVLSRTYRQGSLPQADFEARDPENRWLWRMPRRRLDAEALRDGLLAVAGRLQVVGGGPGLPLEYIENTGGLRRGEVNPPHFNLGRFRPEQEYVRTVYLPIIRSGPQAGPGEVRNVFDFTQPGEFAGRRSTTTVPTQALFLMNGPLLKARAREVAGALLRQEQPAAERLSQLWRQVLGREPAADEVAQAGEFLEQLRPEIRSAGGVPEPEVELRCWSELCHALLASNEFLMLF
ncbi:MAG TPA: hypothetical protein DDY91_19805 [Planctomycetaceae bacterium]|nr:hypothetical protein [Planctomycetaceae bacterium]